MKKAGLCLVPGLFLLTGCLPSVPPTGLPTVCCNQLGTPPLHTANREHLPGVDSDLAGRVYKVGRGIWAKNVNYGLDPNVTFVTYPSSTVEIFHPDRTQVYVTEGLVRKCDADQLAGVLASELGKMAAERIFASPYLDVRDPQGPVHLEAVNDHATGSSEAVELVHSDGQQRGRKAVRPDPRKLAQFFLEKSGYSRGCLVVAQPVLDEASLHHNIECRIKGLPSQPAWTPE